MSQVRWGAGGCTPGAEEQRAGGGIDGGFTATSRIQNQAHLPLWPWFWRQLRSGGRLLDPGG